MSLKKWPVADSKIDEDIQSLNIFGYHCKIFRDDEKAMFIDQGKHLIPWMGDSSLMIDRYDGRGHIYDLKPYDADAVDRHHFDLSDREKAIEKACDEERYLELHTDAMEQQVYEEEEMKRLYEAMGEGYAAVGFNYDQPGQAKETQAAQQQPAEDEEEEDDPYEPMPELQVPKGVTLPTTIKMHAIIEKTADFVAKQGPQMEIVIATKQTNNPQFKFLHYSHELNHYYKHLVKIIKKGKYTAKPQETYQSKKRRCSSEGGEGRHEYLHPSLGGATEPEPQPVSREHFLESVTTKLPSGQIANTAYAKLLSNLSKHRAESPGPSAAPPTKPAAAKPSQSKSKDSKKKPTKPKTEDIKSSSMIDTDITVPGPNQPPPPGTVPPEPPPHHPPPHNTQEEKLNYGPLPQHQYHTQHENGGYLQPHTADAAPQSHYDNHQYGGGSDNYDYYHGYEMGDGYGIEGASGLSMQPKHDFGQSNSSLSSLINDVSEESGDLPPGVTPPSEHLKPIVDKMAQYVVRNGPQFEMMMRNKKDDRFAFLHPGHEHHAYYTHKKRTFRKKECGRESSESGDDSDSAGDNTGSNKGVSFSIKPKDQESAQKAAKKKRPVLYDSDDESAARLERREGGNESSSNEPDRKHAEESLKNKLAVAARGKLAQAKEEEKVKAERKKKAAMFAALLKNSNEAAASSSGLPTVPSASALSSLGGTGATNSPCHLAAPSASSSVAGSPFRTYSRSRTRSPSVVITKETYAKSRSRTPVRKRHHHHHRSSGRRSRSRDRRRSRSRNRKYRSRRSRSRSARRRRSPSAEPLPSAYCVIRRSSSPRLSKRRSRSRTPPKRKRSRRSRSRSPRSSKSRRSRSRSRSKHHKRSKKRSSSKERRKSKKSSRKPKPRMVPIPELTPPPVKTTSSSDNDSDEEEQEAQNGGTSAADSPVRSSDSSDSVNNKPSENILSKVRAMLKAQRDELLKDEAE